VQPTFPSKLLEKVPRTGDIVSFGLERPPGYQYEAGQWFVISLPHGSGEPYAHHFSHSNSPTEPALEFTTRLRGTEFKNALVTLPVGAEVELEGPYGSFTLPEDVERVAFLCGGIGITCVRSILRRLADRSAAIPVPREIVLLYANSSEDGIPFRDELQSLSKAMPGLRVRHVLSRPREGWDGYRGQIDEQILTAELPEPGGFLYFLSGPPSMGRAMRELLLGWGIEAGSIKVERFEGYE
jgi:glycine betaine catabolism B